MSMQELFREIAPGASWAFETIVGVDPSLTGTGLARIDLGGEPTTKVIASTPRVGWVGNAARVREIVGPVAVFMPRKSLVLVEEMYVPRGDKAGGSVIERAWLWGFIVDQAVQRDCQVVVVNNTHRAMLATGAGNAKKTDVIAAMKRRFPGTRIPDSNAADALALAAAGAWWAGFPIEGPTHAGQNEAMRKVPWPTREESNS